jgi:hypothetical protein|tara:strand:- start:1966 stop:2277 length:312 start_codon:yes stop_codon:yes gene_type:complete
MSYAIVKNGVVQNIVVWDGKAEFNIDGELVETTSDTRTGGNWDGNVFSFNEPVIEDVRTYGEKRKSAYASTGDQLDMQYWDSVNDTTTWKDHVASVKAQFPKV